MKEDSDRESEPAEWRNESYSDPVLGCGVPVKISARSDGRIKSYAPFREACAEEAAEKIRSERSVKRSEGYVLNPRRAFERGARDLK